MLYTFAEASYPERLLVDYLQRATPQDAIVLWQDGVYLCLKYPDLFLSLEAPCYALDIDMMARNMQSLINVNEIIKPISVTQLVELSEKHFPQFAL
ncbi:DsrH/TusB family sulfur relay protein [Bisgaard Taxon 45]|uniref:DsrH/TusB family sulfur metabolism protein n=1 Tax=Bisgaard Taxon 45 TaxID=304289 RepID=A0ABT9KFM1_9PAST|nr:DsrH/TusB family sulfur metabolism protein [Bisgaard Taxon 45]